MIDPPIDKLIKKARLAVTLGLRPCQRAMTSPEREPENWPYVISHAAKEIYDGR